LPSRSCVYDAQGLTSDFGRGGFKLPLMSVLLGGLAAIPAYGGREQKNAGPAGKGTSDEVVICVVALGCTSIWSRGAFKIKTACAFSEPKMSRAYLYACMCAGRRDGCSSIATTNWLLSHGVASSSKSAQRPLNYGCMYIQMDRHD